MVFDESRGISVLFGGQDLRGNQLGDVWIYSSRRWRVMRATWSRRPSPRCGHVMAYDEERRAIILFGGIDEDDRALGDTWVFDGSWTRIDGDGPPARRYAAMAYDPGLRGCVLHGGAVDDQGHETHGDAWLLREGVWSSLSDRFATEPRCDHAMAYHHQGQTLVMLGGLAAGRSVLALSRSGWQAAMVEPPHPRHQCAPLAWDDRVCGLVLHGGEARHGGPQFDATRVLRLVSVEARQVP
jgi:hypothetical protein